MSRFYPGIRGKVTNPARTSLMDEALTATGAALIPSATLAGGPDDRHFQEKRVLIDG